MNKIIFGVLLFFSCATKGPNYINSRNNEQRMNTVMKEGKRMRKQMSRARKRGAREKVGIIFFPKNRRKYIN
jgi:hypothetical protein